MATQNGSAGLYVHELHCTNIKKLRHVAVQLKPGVNRVVGENAQGKSTFLDLVRWAIGGAKEMPGEIITRGEERAQIVLKFGEFTVERRFSKNEKGGEDSTLVLVGPDGGRVAKPQTVLEAFYDKYCFDPREFMSMEPAKQLEVMKRLGNLSFGPLEAKRAELYEKRTEVNHRGAAAKARFVAMPTPPKDLPAEPVDVKALLAEQEAKRKIQQHQQEARQKLKDLQRDLALATDELDDDQAAVVTLEKRLAEAKEKVERMAKAVVDLTDTCNAQQELVAGAVEPDFGQLGERISAAQTTNVWFERAKDRAKLEAELEQMRTERDDLTLQIDALDKQKAEAIAAVKFPVDGLTLGDAGPIYNGFALSEASAAEQLRVSVAIGIALNPRLRLMLVRDAALMGTAQLELLKQLSAEHQAQLLVEIAARDSKDLEVLIQEGDVVVVDGDAKVKGAKQQDLGIVVEGRQP